MRDVYFHDLLQPCRAGAATRRTGYWLRSRRAASSSRGCPTRTAPLGVAGIELRHAVAELTWKPKDREKQAAFDRKLALWRHAAVAAQRALPARGAVSAEEGVPPALAQNDSGVASA